MSAERTTTSSSELRIETPFSAQTEPVKPGNIILGVKYKARHGKPKRGATKPEKNFGNHGPRKRRKEKLVWRRANQQLAKTSDNQKNLIKQWGKVHSPQPTKQDKQSKACENTNVSANNARTTRKEPQKTAIIKPHKQSRRKRKMPDVQFRDPDEQQRVALGKEERKKIKKWGEPLEHGNTITEIQPNTQPDMTNQSTRQRCQDETIWESTSHVK